MKFQIFVLLFCALQSLAFGKNIVCFYDSATYVKTGLARFLPSHLDTALQYCTHLIYGYVGLNPITYELYSFSVDLGAFHQAEVTSLKNKYPQLKVYLSVGGDKDEDVSNPEKYLRLLESGKTGQGTFITSAKSWLKRNNFDGLDLAFQFPRNKPLKTHGALASFVESVKMKLSSDYSIVDKNADEHKKQFTNFVQDIKSAFLDDDLSLSLTVLPNVNASWYFNVTKLEKMFTFINVATFDFLTPSRNPTDADYTAPIYAPGGEYRLPYSNIEFQINYWLGEGCPAQKLNLGIASYGRAWKLTTKSCNKTEPLVRNTGGPAEPDLLSQTAGLLSWTETCTKLSDHVLEQSTNITRESPNSRWHIISNDKFGNYAVRLPDDSDQLGLWVSYDTPRQAGIKANYARDIKLGGVALFELGHDDFRGLCTGKSYPILEAIKNNLFEILTAKVNIKNCNKRIYTLFCHLLYQISAIKITTTDQFSNMKLLILLTLLLGLNYANSANMKNLVCFYDSASYIRSGFAKLLPGQLDVALQFCTHLIYGYAGLKPDSKEIFSLNVDLDMFHYAEITLFKAKYPHLKIYLSIGGDSDIDEEHPLKYVELLESDTAHQQAFIDSSIELIKRNGFDGLDLSFQFPKNKPRKVHGTLGTYWKKFKKLFTGNFIVDTQAEEHKRQYTEFVSNLNTAFRRHNLSLSMTVLPNVNSTWYFDVPKIQNNFELINLAAFDFLTPIRNPEEADYTAPIYPPLEQNRLPHYNIEFQVNYWLNNHCPPEKLNLGIASYGRAWKLSPDSGLTGAPVVPETVGPADAGLQSQIPGILSWPEICSMLPNAVNKDYRGPNAPVMKVVDLEQRYGNYAVRPADEQGEHGMWISFDDPDFAVVKTNYAKYKGLGGIALFDVGFDDFRGLCTGFKFPFVRSIKNSM
ncbi:uncharacterized protein LOC119688345 [Teleopsis dalmanni]|uniref:uncharacterized protein LOC119688345 n=1 Tax=Teleopsis dalmanni TaxID=139649 RepID=UPI0018CE97A6|nr:uncharacterized protein LOC119688345 [Teleopsis dalmanni]